ncbi:transposase [Streptomyces chiangmaiensis]|uniref:Transposase n=1 Tax=Streptomyces chiangmaiensis TaxID=766497 RepID=A0ABU7FJ56_9ACTN|nr:transposase [Streptomyces chiangmaiensis]MED7824011.1 transposase [Streptomyces chiangmaiensis]
MAMKDYSDEFKGDAVALYESTPGVTYKGIAADLGISRGSLRNWVLRKCERRGVGPAGDREAAAGAGQMVLPPDPDERIRWLEARAAELEASERKLATEQGILRKAAKYFAGETNWWGTASSSSTTTGAPSA